MSNNQATEKNATARRERIRIRVDRLRQSRQRSVMVGVAELAGLAASAIMVLAVIFTYLYFYSPAQSRLSTAQRDRARLQEKLSTLQKDLDVKGTTQDSVSRISESLEKFETERLTGRDQGRIILYNVLIQLIRGNNLRNTSGPSYTYLEAKAPTAQQRARGSAKLQSLYPGIGVTVTVEGQYANLRHFVRDIESSNQFIIINAVELERASDADNAAGPPGGPAPRSTLVSLKIDMAAYFQREVNGEMAEQPASEAR
ncbi:MAG TPA: GspMb/PilO family protein [Pyrinomonadaceae bacterium]